ncbi:hypothetical protein GCM10010341_84120 [Streptomyces noursei]|nr:hypothetical protein GCM10010341_84120 [Streptomyces noursei]
MQRKHPKTGRRKIYRQYGGRRSWWTGENRELFDPITVAPRATAIGQRLSLLPGRPRDEELPPRPLRGLCGAKSHARFGKRLRGNGPVERPVPRPGPTSPLDWFYRREPATFVGHRWERSASDEKRVAEFWKRAGT